MRAPDVTIARERPDQPDVLALLAALDRYLGTLYRPEDNHILGPEGLLAPEVEFLAARERGALMGVGALRRAPGEPATGGRPYVEIKRMVVDPASRGRRIGARILEALEEIARRDGFALALLETGALQSAAIRLYERCGYAPRGPFGGYMENGASRFFAKVL